MYTRFNHQKDGSLLSFLSSIEVVVLDDDIQVLYRKSVIVLTYSCIGGFVRTKKTMYYVNSKQGLIIVLPNASNY